jgi:hypothetical protein
LASIQNRGSGRKVQSQPDLALRSTGSSDSFL